MQTNKIVILGSGITGLSVGLKLGNNIYESCSFPGGISTSYYISSKGEKSYQKSKEELYHFEIGGGHWIFGADNEILNFINSLSPVKSYNRKSAVYFPDTEIYVPYPIQNHLYYLPEEIKEKALKEILRNSQKKVDTVLTMADYLELNFGKTLCEIFFFPFHKLYTDGLFTEIAPQDKFKTPIDKNLILEGSKGKTISVGYNATFVYPKNGLDDLIKKIEQKCKVKYNKKVVKINIKNKEVLFEDGNGVKYEKIISSLPLNKVIQMTDIELDEQLPQYTSVSVINIGAIKGEKCPEYHWLYIPKSKAGFHRVGFYSNVDSLFLPLNLRKNNDRVSIYVEKAYKGGKKLTDYEIKKLCNDIVKELQNWKFIKETEVVDHTFVEIAYTWQYPNSNWLNKAIEILKKHNIIQTGRYGKWKFQGIAESIKDGLGIKIL